MKNTKKHITSLLVAFFLMGPAIPAQAVKIICDPQAGITSYKMMPKAESVWIPPASTPAQPDGSLSLVIDNIPAGKSDIEVAACVGEGSVWEKCSPFVPFGFTKPGIISPLSPANLKLSK